MAWHRIMTTTTRVVRQFGRDRRSVALLFLAPLLVLTLLNFVINSTSSTATLGIVPPAEPLGTQLLSQLRQHATSNLTLKSVDRAGVDAALKNGDVDGVLIFPDDLLSAIQSGAGAPIGVTLRLEGSNPGVAKQLDGFAQLLIQNALPPSPTLATTVSVTPNLQKQTTYLYGGPEYTQTDALAPLLIGLFAFFFVFLLTSVAFLRERSQGTIERLLVSPLRRAELVLGYVCGFTLFALLQSLIILIFVIFVLRVHYQGNLGLLFLVTVLLTIGGVNLGIFASAFARNELQVIQFIPLFLIPQVLLGGLFFPIKTLPIILHQLAYCFPLTYANFALQDIMLRGFGLDGIWGDLVFLAGFAAVMVLLSSLSLRGEKA